MEHRGACRRAALRPRNSISPAIRPKPPLGIAAGDRHACPMTSERQQRGLDAETRAARHMQRADFEILLRNFRCRLGELDIVARRDELLVVAEVRLRTSADFGGAADSVTLRKRQ